MRILISCVKMIIAIPTKLFKMYVFLRGGGEVQADEEVDSNEKYGILGIFFRGCAIYFWIVKFNQTIPCMH